MNYLLKKIGIDCFLPKIISVSDDILPSFDMPRPISYQHNTRKNLNFHLQTALPHKYQGVKRMSNNRRNYTTIYCSLHKKAAKKLKDLAEKRCKTESEVLRNMLNIYLKKIKNKDLSYNFFKRATPIESKFIARTITKEQDKKLRLLAEKTGRSISEMVREEVEDFS